MDLKFKGKTWAGNIFQKFEAMYQEVDDFVSQEKVKYVENQVHTMGKSVQNFCSGVVQDLLPPFLDPAKHEAQGVPQSMKGFEEKPVDIDTMQSSVEWDSFDIPYPVKQENSLPTQDPIKETNSKGNDKDAEGNVNSDTGVGEIVKDKQYLCEDLEENKHNGILDEISPNALVNGEGIRLSEGEHCNCFDIGPLDDSRVDIADPRMKGIDLCDKVKLDDSRVIVDSESLCAVSYRARKLTSYKKLIQDAFTSRKRLTKEYKQLAIWYGDIDIESTQHPKENTAPPSFLMPSESKEPPTLDSCDSEWELL